VLDEAFDELAPERARHAHQGRWEKSDDFVHEA
jgi:hypothetical protein